MQQPRPSLNGLIRLLAVASVAMFALSAVSLSYDAGRHAGVSTTPSLTSAHSVN